MNQDVDLAGAVEPRTTIHAGTLGALDRAMIGVNKLMMLVGMIALLVASLVLTYSVFSRYLFKAATDWQDEVAVFLLVCSTFMCGAYVQSYRGHVGIEVHDSGPGLSDQARASLFEPTISFKKRGMGLGLSIARKSALLSGGDIVLVKGELGGAGFRVLLPAAHGIQTYPDRG